MDVLSTKLSGNYSAIHSDEDGITHLAISDLFETLTESIKEEIDSHNLRVINPEEGTYYKSLMREGQVIVFQYAGILYNPQRYINLTNLNSIQGVKAKAAIETFAGATIHVELDSNATFELFTLTWDAMATGEIYAPIKFNIMGDSDYPIIKILSAERVTWTTAEITFEVLETIGNPEILGSKIIKRIYTFGNTYALNAGSLYNS